MKTIRKNVVSLALVFAVSVASSVIDAGTESGSAPSTEKVVSASLPNKTSVLGSIKDGWNKVLGGISGRYTRAKVQAAGVHTFVVTDKVGDNMSWARYAMILRNIGGMTFGVLATYLAIKKILCWIKSSMQDLNEVEAAQAIERRKKRQIEYVVL